MQGRGRETARIAANAVQDQLTYLKTAKEKIRAFSQ